MHRAVPAVVVGVVALVAAACGSSEKPGESAPAKSQDLPGRPIAPWGAAWKDLSHAQRVEHMKKAVLPAMKAEFQTFDAKDFADFNCATCHGQGAKDKSFKMPNPDLPKLVATPEGFKQLEREEPKITNFMTNTVVPRMSALLGVEPYSAKTQTGFGCFRCHTEK